MSSSDRDADGVGCQRYRNAGAAIGLGRESKMRQSSDPALSRGLLLLLSQQCESAQVQPRFEWPRILSNQEPTRNRFHR